MGWKEPLKPYVGISLLNFQCSIDCWSPLIPRLSCRISTEFSILFASYPSLFFFSPSSPVQFNHQSHPLSSLIIFLTLNSSEFSNLLIVTYWSHIFSSQMFMVEIPWQNPLEISLDLIYHGPIYLSCVSHPFPTILCNLAAVQELSFISILGSKAAL